MPEYAYDQYSELTGPLIDPPADQPYRVTYRPLNDGTRRLRALLLTMSALAFELVFLVWLLQPSHYPENTGDWRYYLSLSMIVSIALIEGMRLVNVATLVRATLSSADPVPVTAQPGLSVAFLTTIVPGKEPLAMLRATVTAATKIRHDGIFDIWVLDEGNDPDVRAMCAELGVNHFSRKGLDHFNQETGRNKRKTKHGNYNAWFDTYGEDYEFWVSVDTDHVPLPNFAERLLGYFRDPDVAFVVGPQVYGNYDNFITKAAESQQYLFHSVLQRAGNRWGTAMFVGTNNAVRLSALRQIGGMQDSITEDAATSLVWHSTKNANTGNVFKSVYTPDVLAVGEGPTSWTDYFIQQNRWARGTNEVMLRKFIHFARQLSPGRRTHYALLMSYYPSAALAWILGSFNMAIYLLTGVGGVQVAAQLWLMLYVNAAVLQMAIYFWNRKFNVSPHEEAGSSGASGMLVSILSAPMYVTALVDAVRGRDVPFEVTPKGDDGSPDQVLTFRKNLMWGGLLATTLAASFVLGNDHPSMRLWAVLGIVISFLPVTMWKIAQLRAQRRSPEPAEDNDALELLLADVHLKESK